MIRGSCLYAASIIICSEHIACALGSKYRRARTLYAHKCELAVHTLHIRGLHACTLISRTVQAFFCAWHVRHFHKVGSSYQICFQVHKLYQIFQGIKFYHILQVYQIVSNSFGVSNSSGVSNCIKFFRCIKLYQILQVYQIVSKSSGVSNCIQIRLIRCIKLYQILIRCIKIFWCIKFNQVYQIVSNSSGVSNCNQKSLVYQILKLLIQFDTLEYI